MKSNFYKTGLIAFIVLASIIFTKEDLVAQEKMNFSKKFQIGLTARSYGDSVYLRWVLTDPIAWRMFKANGLIIERAKVNSDGSAGRYERLITEPIKPWSIEKWEEYFNSRGELDQTQLDNEAVAFILAIGEESDEDLTPPQQEEEKDFLKSITEKKSGQEWGLLLTLLAANNSLTAAEGLGLFYVDRNVVPNETYSYKIYSEVKTELYSYDTTSIVVKNTSYEPKSFLQKLEAKENEGSIEIIWKQNEQFSTFNVERSEDGATFKRLNDAPLLTLKAEPDSVDGLDSFLDTLVINYKPYIYRVYAKTVFADEVLIGEIKAMGRDRTPPEQPFVPQPIHISDREVKITWKMADPPAKDLAGFYVGRDSLINGSFKPIHSGMLPPSTSEFIDKSFSLSGYNFYLVEAVDTAGNSSKSYPVYVVLNDTIPPSPPKWKEAFMDSNGVVTLRLIPNEEYDLMGYRILKANSPEHEFSSIIESFGEDMIDYRSFTEFRDTVELNTTTKYVYYRATALDLRYNESDFSAIIAVPRPDIVPPVAPVIIDAQASDKDITIQFIPSSSEDVRNHIIFKKQADEERWDTIAVLDAADSIFIDRDVKQNILYDYVMVAVDSSNLISDMSAAIQAKPYYLGILPEIKNFNAVYDDKHKVCNLSWEYENLPDVYFVVYRSYENEPMRRYKTIKLSDIRIFADNDFANGIGKYFYAIKAFNNLNAESVLSEKREILVR